jgi:mono/diheme cytochrome c family protein/uncharacterized membrane protein
MIATFQPVLFLGRMHPLLVHLPIGFLVLLLALEIATRFKRFAALSVARPLVVGLTVAASVLTIVLGLMLKSGGGYDPNLIFWHQWTGILFGLTVIAVAVAVWKKSRLYNGSLVAALLLLTVASHFGASLSHGPGYLTEYAPGWVRTLAGDVDHRPAEVIATSRPTDVRSARLYADVVRPILATNCVACHGPERTSGHLRLDSYAGITAAHADHAIADRMLLPLSDSHHMPPVDKPQPTDEQIALVRWWTDSGASDSKTVGELKPTADQLQLVAKATRLPIDAAVVATSDQGPPPPPPVESLATAITDISVKTGVMTTRVSAGLPWIACNAAFARSFGDDQLRQLAPLAANIQSLDLAGTKVTDAGLAVVGTMRHLAHLRLERTAITDAGLKSLAGLPELEYLNLYGTKVTDASLPTLKTMPSLAHLYLWGTRVDADAAEKFAASKPDELKIRLWQKQIDDLRREIDRQQIEVVDGVRPTTKPADTQPAVVQKN